MYIVLSSCTKLSELVSCVAVDAASGTFRKTRLILGQRFFSAEEKNDCDGSCRNRSALLYRLKDSELSDFASR